MKENEIEEIIDETNDLPFGITDEEYIDVKGDFDDTNKN